MRYFYVPAEDEEYVILLDAFIFRFVNLSALTDGASCGFGHS